VPRSIVLNLLSFETASFTILKNYAFSGTCSRYWFKEQRYTRVRPSDFELVIDTHKIIFRINCHRNKGHSES